MYAGVSVRHTGGGLVYTGVRVRHTGGGLAYVGGRVGQIGGCLVDFAGDQGRVGGGAVGAGCRLMYILCDYGRDEAEGDRGPGPATLPPCENGEGGSCRERSALVHAA